jgi:hypothetical protein
MKFLVINQKAALMIFPIDLKIHIIRVAIQF